MMNNKMIGTYFERKMRNLLNNEGWWVHFIEPKQSGAQPFDIIAVKNGRAIAVDCKTCVSNNFPLSRLEDNQIYAFEKWIRCGNSMPYVAVEHEDEIYMIPYDYLRDKKVVKLEDLEWAKWGVLPV